MKLNDLKNKIEIDIEGSLARFGNMESFYIKFLKKFVDDKSFETLSSGIENKNLKDIKDGAHTLKGVAGNLGLKKIYDISKKLMEINDEVDENILMLYKDLKNEIEKTKEVLKNLD
ncbi:Hpt domain-containing protein [uncultured Fusobacterium sp.]|uniref:Hpt domain-containing protein n=1 Tax=uncultured Fusobacterium sp. TaxID=159267 RepID=UPI0025D6C062|nr:Hpt domain-containing protein [uncultured Fusobacterium sp.]